MTDNQSGDIGSAQKSLPSTQPPGWNDPPKWAFSPGQSPGAGSKRVLNKRVAFPLNSPLNASKATGNELPKPPTLSPPLPTCPIRDSSDINPEDTSNARANCVEFDNEKPSLNEAFENLQFALKEYVSQEKTEEVQKRLDVMKTAWQEDEINDAVRQRILDISKALREKNMEEADRIHIGLIMHHGNVCSSWISGIRHMILELKDKYQQTSIGQAEKLCEDLLAAATAEM